MKLHMIAISLVTVLMSCATHDVQSNKSKPNLCAQLAADLEFIHKTMAENNSNYNGSAQQATESNLAYKTEVERPCHSNLEYARAIKRYLASYHDPHVNSLWTEPDAMHRAVIEFSTGAKVPAPVLRLEWTAIGVYLQRYKDGYFVKATDSKINSPLKVGDELLSCDDKSPGQILNDEILPYVSVSAKEAAIYRFTPMVFVRWDQKIESEVNCEIKRNKSRQSVRLTWKPVPEDYLQKTFQPQSKQIYELEKTPYGHWIKLKSLGGYDQAVLDQLKHFVSDAQKLRGDKIVVVDLRGNNGGSSNWGTDWIDNLFGYHADWDKQIQESVFVSPGNVKHFERFYQHLESTGGIQGDYTKAIWSDLLTALRNTPVGRFAPLKEPSVPEKPKGKSGFKGRIFVLTDYNVFSSGETFLEQLRMMPRVTHAGVASNASTFFSDIRFVVTPAGLPFDFPTKMDSGDPLGRKSGEALHPDWPLSYDAKAELAGRDSLRVELEKRLRDL